jgi:hypothetical protein
LLRPFKQNLQGSSSDSTFTLDHFHLVLDAAFGDPMVAPIGWPRPTYFGATRGRRNPA